MKNFFSVLMLLASMSISFNSCTKESNIKDTTGLNKARVRVIANSDETKSYFGDPASVDGKKKYPVIWTDTKDAAFSLDETAFVSATPTVSSDGKSASFDVQFEESFSSDGTGKIYAFSPMGVYDKNNHANNVPGFTSVNSKYHDAFIIVPTEQTPMANSCDELTHALVAESDYIVEDGEVSDLEMHFSHVLAYGKMKITNFEGTIKSVSINFPVAVAGTSCKYYFADATDEKGEYTAGKIYGADNSTLTLDAANVVDNEFWFACVPTGTLSEGNMVISVTDNSGKTYTRNIALSAKSIAFNKGEVSSFNVSMENAQLEDKSVTWDLSKVEDGLSASADALVWTSDLMVMKVEKGKSSTNANNYYPGTDGKDYSSTRFYTNSIFTITPAVGVTISKVVFNATTSSYANALAGSTWQNATAIASVNDVTVTPVNGANAISATIGATCGFTAITVYYSAKQIETINVTGVSLNESTLELEAGKSETLIATVSPADATNKNVTWMSSNTAVATVVDGKVTAVAEGEATITVTTVEGNFTSTCTVKVTASSESYLSNVTWTLGSNAYSDQATINGVDNVAVLKLGTSKNSGNATIKLPAGTSSMKFYCIAWTGTSAKVQIGDMTYSPVANSGATGNSPYTLTVSDSDKYTLSFDTPLVEETELSLSADKRVILFAINAE